MKYKRKIIIVIILLIALLLVLMPKSDDQIRVRVLSNSNSQYDTEIKQKVSEVVVKTIKKYHINYDNITTKIDVIDEAIKQTFSDIKYEIEFLDSYYDAKTQNDTLTKSGYYKTLLITIEAGNGKNYFSILYPNYYNEYKTDEVIFKSYLYEIIKKYWRE